tara:strand:+ start:4801 stop:5787 length:987 start_codon:yes stop_codon:yes gene_type:complete
MKNYFFTFLRLITFNYFFERRKKNKLVIFMFHRVNDEKHVFYRGMSIKAFKNLCVFIKNHYSVINPSEIEKHFKKTKTPAAIISFDDGHHDIIENAFPILKDLDLPFNLNIDTEILETGKPQDFVRIYDILNNSNLKEYKNSSFMDESIQINRANPAETEQKFTEILMELSIKNRRLFIDQFAKHSKMDDAKFSKMLSTQDLKFLLKNKAEIGSHSHTHPILTKINTNEIQSELQLSKKILEKITNDTIQILAYPNGLYNDEVKSIAKKTGYTILLQTDDEINQINNFEGLAFSYKRINQYHQTVSEALAHTYGKTKILKSIKGKLKT